VVSPSKNGKDLREESHKKELVESILEESKDQEQGEDISPGIEEELKEQVRGVVREWRETLPFLRDPKKKIGIWSFIKNHLGQDITRVSAPVAFNDPTSTT